MVIIQDGTKTCPGVKFATQTDNLNQVWVWEWLGLAASAGRELGLRFR